MPTWLILSVLRLIARYGLPLVEKQWPALTPIIDEILKILGGKTEPSPHLLSAANHYNDCVGAQCGVPV